MALPCCFGFDRPKTENMENENMLVKMVGEENL